MDLCNRAKIEIPPIEALEAAEEGLGEFAFIFGGKPSKGAMIDFGFRVYTIEPSILLEGEADSFVDILKPMDIWRFLVKSEEEGLSLVTVEMSDSKWQVVSCGAGGIANEIYRIRKIWLEDSGYSLGFIRIHIVRADIVQVFRNGVLIGYAPLQSGERVFGHPSGVLLKDSEVFSILRRFIGDMGFRKSGNF